MLLSWNCYITRVCPCRVYAGHENAVQCQKHAFNAHLAPLNMETLLESYSGATIFQPTIFQPNVDLYTQGRVSRTAAKHHHSVH